MQLLIWRTMQTFTVVILNAYTLCIINFCLRNKAVCMHNINETLPPQKAHRWCQEGDQLHCRMFHL